jgi:hypothetical protein
MIHDEVFLPQDFLCDKHFGISGIGFKRGKKMLSGEKNFSS